MCTCEYARGPGKQVIVIFIFMFFVWELKDGMTCTYYEYEFGEGEMPDRPSGFLQVWTRILVQLCKCNATEELHAHSTMQEGTFTYVGCCYC